MKFKYHLFLLILLGAGLSCAFTKPNDFPNKKWQQYIVPEEAGFSSEELELARQKFEESEAAGVLVIYDGQVLVSWGDTARRFRCASVRKSFMNALYGIYVGKEKIDLSETLADLKIDDVQSLTAQEKQAKVVDLLTARSGIFHPAAYSPRNMAKNLPQRGSHAPGTFWYYNNWDFNTLATIFEQETQKVVFETFKEDIADQIQMEDFELRHTHYRFEDKSQHPAYLFRMTARDMARFGLLYLNNGRWNGKQIIPEEWVAESTKPFSTELGRFSERGSFGYLWWVSQLRGQRMYFASGSGGQRICVLPDANLVFVHVVNSYDNNNVRHGDIMSLLGLILDAKEGEPKSKPNLVGYKPPETDQPKAVKVNDEILSKYVGSYRHRFLGKLEIGAGEKSLIMTTGIGKFKLFPMSESEFFPEDIETPVHFQKASEENRQNTAVSMLNKNRKVEKVVFYY